MFVSSARKIVLPGRAACAQVSNFQSSQGLFSLRLALSLFPSRRASRQVCHTRSCVCGLQFGLEGRALKRPDPCCAPLRGSLRANHHARRTWQKACLQNTHALQELVDADCAVADFSRSMTPKASREMFNMVCLRFAASASTLLHPTLCANGGSESRPR